MEFSNQFYLYFINKCNTSKNVAIVIKIWNIIKIKKVRRYLGYYFVLTA